MVKPKKAQARADADAELEDHPIFPRRAVRGERVRQDGAGRPQRRGRVVRLGTVLGDLDDVVERRPPELHARLVQQRQLHRGFRRRRAVDVPQLERHLVERRRRGQHEHAPPHRFARRSFMSCSISSAVGGGGPAGG